MLMTFGIFAAIVTIVLALKVVMIKYRTKKDGEGFVYKRAVIIGVDGAGANFEDAYMPNLDRLVEEGAVGYRVLTSEPTISAQCWGSLLTGVPPEVHGLTNELVESTPYDAFSDHPTIFRIIRENDPNAKLASFCGWEPINIGIIEDNIGVRKGNGTDEEVVEMACNYIKQNDPKLMFVHFEEVDVKGHSIGYRSDEYFRQLSVTDKYIGKIYDTLKEQDMLDTTLFIVTADHGGVGTGHGGSSDEEKYVMYLAVGNTIRKCFILSMNIRDNAAIVMQALGYKQPEDWSARIPAGLF